MTLDRKALATELLASKRPALMDIWCGRRGDPRPGGTPSAKGHRLGHDYDTGPRAGVVIVIRKFTVPATELAEDLEPEIIRSDAYAYPIDHADSLLARCEHGIYIVKPGRVAAWLAGDPSAEPGV